MSYNNILEFLRKNNYNGTKALVSSAKKLGIKTSLTSKKESIIKYSYGNKFIFSEKHRLPFNTAPKAITTNKHVTKNILSKNDIKTPRGIYAKTASEAWLLCKKNKLKYPLIVKPLDASLAYGVTRHISNKTSLFKAITFCKKRSPKSNIFIVEEMFYGDEFRVLILDGHVIACAKKLPSGIIGNGKESLEQLIKKFNKKNIGKKFISLRGARAFLKQKSLNTKVIPRRGVWIQIGDSMLLRDGGLCLESLNSLTKELEDVCIKATKVLSLTYAGIDILINAESGDYSIIEVNSSPVHIINEQPLCKNAKINISEKLLQYFFDIKTK